MSPNTASPEPKVLAQATVAAIGAGALVGLVTKAFMVGIHEATKLLWEELPDQLSIEAFGVGHTLTVTLTGGLLVGLVQKYGADQPRPLMEILNSFKGTEADPPNPDGARVLPAAMANSVASLGFGGPFGPEAAIGSVISALYVSLHERLRPLLDLLSSTTEQGPRLRRLFGLVAVLSGYVVMRAVPGAGLEYEQVPGIDTLPSALELVSAAAFGLVGAGLGHVFGLIEHRGVHAKFVETSPVVAGLAGGLLLGLVALPNELVLFSGQEQVEQLIDGSQGQWDLAYVGVAKFFLVGAMLAAGWRGGNFYPLMYAMAALAGAFALGADIGAVPAFAGAQAGALAGLTRKPVVAGVLSLLIVPPSMAPLLLAGLAGAALVLAATPEPAATK